MSLGLAGACCAGGKAGSPIPVPAPVSESKAAPADWAEFYPGEMWQKKISAEAAGGTILIAYGGYGADEPGTKNWAGALAAAGGFNYAVAVKGPALADYSDHKKKKANELLIKALTAMPVTKIVISAHSSGTYVAHELLAMLALKENSALPGKTVYYDLDGATCLICPKLSAASAGFKFTCVGARQGALKSPNYASVKACGQAHFLSLDFNAGCTGAWCLHACLINTAAAAIDANRPSVPRYYADPGLSVASGYLESGR